MIRLWLTFGIFAVLIHFCIAAWRALSGKEKWNLTKSIGYSILVSLLAIVVLMSIVKIF